jgi:uncharacterized protein with FMN-binding domain
MRRITLWLLSTIAAVVLAFSYRTSTTGAGGETTAVAAAPANPAPTAATPTPTTPSTTGSPSPSATRDSGGDAGSGTYQGSVAQTRWGPIQVTITVAGGKITDVQVPIYPNGNHRDEEINAYALPALRQATLDAQSAQVDTVSGATVTTDGYRESLQAALDAAHL